MHLRALLAVAMIAVIGLTVAVVILAINDNADTSAARLAITAPAPTGNTRYDGGPEEGTRGTITPPGSNYNGPH